MAERDFKYRTLVSGKAEWDEGMKKLYAIKSAQLKECAETFENNLHRTMTFAVMPSEVAFVVRRDQILYDVAFNRINQKPATLDDYMERDGISEEVEAEAFSQMEKFKALSPGQITEVKIHLGVNCIEALIKMRPEMQASADALFGSVVMESWTAFECLAADLWVIVVNNGPAKFRQDVLASKYLKNGKSTSSKGEKASSIDPGKDFAGGLREQGRVSFQTLWNIQNYYEIICGKAKGKEIFALCDSYLTRHRLRPTRWKGEEGRGLRGARCRS